MKIIQQYKLDPGWCAVEMPADAECLSVGLVDDGIVIRAIHEMPKLTEEGEFEAPVMKTRNFTCALESSLIPSKLGRYLGSVRVPQGGGITTYHVFEAATP